MPKYSVRPYPFVIAFFVIIFGIYVMARGPSRVEDDHVGVIPSEARGPSRVEDDHVGVIPSEGDSRPKRLSQNDIAYKQEILNTFNAMAGEFDEISHVTLDGSILDVHYATRVSTSQFRQDAAGIAMSFSTKKNELLGVSGVTVRCVHRGRIYAQASARGGKVTKIES